MNAPIPSSPFFVPPYKPEHGGVDFLGLRQANLEMMAACLPGINNVTSYVRAFSVLSWIHWKFHQITAEQKLPHVSSRHFHEFRERVELLFTWGHSLNNLGRLPGTTSLPPPGDADGVPLTFEAWKRNGANTSLMAPVQYGPASKTQGGLGFLDPVEAGLFRACGEGVRLAEALDRNLMARASAPLLGLEPSKGTEDAAMDLFEGWNILAPTPEERFAFRKAFFDEKSVGQETELGRRSSTLDLVRRLLAWARQPLTQEELRRAMVYARRPGLPAFEVPPQLTTARLRWSVLQLRQAQRFAHECLLVWIERKLRQGARDSETLASEAATLLRDALPERAPQLTLGELSQQWVPGSTSFEALCEQAVTNDEACLFAAIERTTEALYSEDDALVVHAIRTLLLSASVSGLLAVEPAAERAMRLGGTDRVSLTHWRAIVTRCKPMSLREFLLFLFESMVLSQHFAVAANRYDGGTQRLRITIEEEGLTRLASDNWWPRLSLDRLGAALLLSSDCGLILAARDSQYEAA